MLQGQPCELIGRIVGAMRLHPCTCTRGCRAGCSLLGLLSAASRLRACTACSIDQVRDACRHRCPGRVWAARISQQGSASKCCTRRTPTKVSSCRQCRHNSKPGKACSPKVLQTCLPTMQGVIAKLMQTTACAADKPICSGAPLTGTWMNRCAPLRPDPSSQPS